MTDSGIHHIKSDGEFSALLSSHMYVVADFYADWCGPCKAIAPLYAQLAKTHSIPKFLAFAKIDVDSVQPVAQRYSVSAMPTFMFFKNGNQVAVHGQPLIRGADAKSLKDAVEKMGGLAKTKAALAENK